MGLLHYVTKHPTILLSRQLRHSVPLRNPPQPLPHLKVPAGPLSIQIWHKDLFPWKVLLFQMKVARAV